MGKWSVGFAVVPVFRTRRSLHHTPGHRPGPAVIVGGSWVRNPRRSLPVGVWRVRHAVQPPAAGTTPLQSRTGTAPASLIAASIMRAAEGTAARQRSIR